MVYGLIVVNIFCIVVGLVDLWFNRETLCIRKLIRQANSAYKSEGDRDVWFVVGWNVVILLINSALLAINLSSASR